jgi:Flp pilus assembly pilin Flp
VGETRHGRTITPSREFAKPSQGLCRSGFLPVMNRIRLSGERGQTMAEYAVVLAVISILTLAAFTLLGTRVGTEISKVAGYINF